MAHFPFVAMAHKKSSEGSAEFSLELADGPQRTPGQQKVIEETISATARYALRRCGQNMSFATAPERADRLQNAIKRVDLKYLGEMIVGDLECDGKDWGPWASGTASYLERVLGIEPKIAREKLKTIDVQSPTLIKDVLQLSEGTHQDMGFFMVQQTPEGEKKIGFDEMDLEHLKGNLAKEA